jgi:CBS-domain-containing membrane protein
MPIPLERVEMFTTQAPPRPPVRKIVVSTLSSCVALGILTALTVATGHLWLIPPMAASMALIMGVPNLPLAQPRNVIGGQTVSAVVGVLVGIFGDSLWLGALAGGLALGAMMVARMPHSPAAATAVLGVSVDTSIGFVVLALLAAVVLVIVGLVGNKVNRTEYPTYVW